MIWFCMSHLMIIFNDINENTDYFRRKMKILNLMDNKSFKKKINIRVARLSKYIDFYDYLE